MKIEISPQDNFDIVGQKIRKLVDEIMISHGAGMYELTPCANKRTSPQNNAIHKYCDNLAKHFNEQGITKKAVFKILKECAPWDKDSVKRELWCFFQKHLGYGEKTSKLHTKEVSEIYDLVNLFTSEKLGIGVEFGKQDVKPMFINNQSR